MGGINWDVFATQFVRFLICLWRDGGRENYVEISPILVSHFVMAVPGGGTFSQLVVNLLTLKLNN